MRIGFVLFPDVTALDVVGPYEVLSRVPHIEPVIVAAAAGPVRAQYGLSLAADVSWAGCPPVDVLCVPGGPGQVAAMEDPHLLQFLRVQAEGTRYLAGICTGALLLGAAGLLRGYRATTHWRYIDCLRDLGAVPVRKRVVADQDRITAAGVSAGVDMGLFLAALLAGEGVAQTIQLQMEYDPQPPFRSGSPEHADPDLLEQMLEETRPLYMRRREQSKRLGAAFG